ncbi:MAG: septal ring lytic transglycosylase RlpA family protein [Melioribacteraceae bacterium]|nr:septal ring lytic transglycosylase RlpA family protein [Melioribacteraceae bacterium]
MRYIKILSLFSLLVAVIGFINLSDTSASDNNGFPKIVESKESSTTLNQVEINDLGIMTASWYGPRFHGKSTANGELFDQSALTAAHKSLPFGTILQITNIRNNKSVIIRINDRGPYVEGRDLDLSKATAKALGILHKGVVKVKVKELKINADNEFATTLN